MWQALNEPVIEISEPQAMKIFLLAAVIAGMAWITPYWAEASEIADQQLAMGYDTYQSQVLGATIEASEPASIVQTVPDWYIEAAASVSAVQEAYTAAAAQVLDVSAPVTEAAEYYQPGVDAVTNAWLNLMCDPGSRSF